MVGRNGSCAGGSHIDVLKLPSVAKVANDTYRAKYMSISSETIWGFRNSLLVEAAKHLNPDVVLVDKAPAGMRGELVETLEWIREHRPDTRVIFGMRDIEDEPSVTIDQWAKLGIPEILEACYDEIWVYGMQNVFDVAREYQLSDRVVAKIKYMGYVAQEFCEHEVGASDGVPHVLVTVGGGTDGAAVLENYLAEAAREMAAQGVHSFVVAGPDLPPRDGRRLRRIAERIPNTEWFDFAPCMMCLIRQASLVVCMGGYNTLCEVARQRTPALVIPRTKPRLEQMIRSKLWADRGAIEVFNPDDLTPPKLANHVSTMWNRNAGATAPDLDLEGSSRVLERFNSIWNREGRHATAVSV